MTAKISSLFWHQTGLHHAFSSCVCANRAYYCLFIRHSLVISKLSSRVNISQFRHSCIWAFTIVIVECSLVVSQSYTLRSDHLKNPKRGVSLKTRILLVKRQEPALGVRDRTLLLGKIIILCYILLLFYYYIACCCSRGLSCSRNVFEIIRCPDKESGFASTEIANSHNSILYEFSNK